jgi:alanine racemase
MRREENNFRSWTEINLDHFCHNITELKKFMHPDVAWLQVVKADAYGHGAIEISREAENLGANWLGVANADEGTILRLERIQTNILILSPSLVSEIDDIIQYDLVPSISCIEFAEKLNQAAEKQGIILRVHINFDTGMGRAGFLWTEAKTVAEKLKNFSHLEIEGVFSHFSMSEEPKDEFTPIQAKRFDSAVQALRSTGIYPKIKHISNSAGIINFPEFQYDMVRLGLASYGIYPDSRLVNSVSLRPVMTFKSKISLIKDLPANFGISYRKSFITNKPIKAAILPVGYGDGYNFLLSNCGKVIIRGKLCPVLGRVTMDMIVADISNVPDAEVGDEVTLLGENGNLVLSAEEISSLYNGLSYETVSNIGRRAQRIFILKNKDTQIEPISRRSFIAKDFSNPKLEKIIQSSINQRLNSKEIGRIIYSELLEDLLATSDQGITWKRDFSHKVIFYLQDKSQQQSDPSSRRMYLVKTELSYKKVLQREWFKIVCANSLKDLEGYFQSPVVEYRWLLDRKINLTDSFKIDEILVDGIPLDYKVINNHSHRGDEVRRNLEIECDHPSLKNLIGKEVTFTINTTTYYPIEKHELSIYISELTKGLSVTFDFANTDIKDVEAITIFAGKEKYPSRTTGNKQIVVKTTPDEWVFPNSGIVFVW